MANRLHFELVYSYLFAGADRGVPLTIMLVSIPSDGPDALRALGESIQDTTRSADLVAHLGHGRFAVLLLGCNLQGGILAADRVEQALASLGHHRLPIGLAAYQPEMKEPVELLAAADGALTAAEEAGGGLETA